VSESASFLQNSRMTKHNATRYKSTDSKLFDLTLEAKHM